MKKTIIITTGLYPSEGILSFIKYISIALVSNKDFMKKYNFKILLFNEDIKKKTKKIIYNSFLLTKNLFTKKKGRIHKLVYSAVRFKKENKYLSKYIEYFGDENDYYKFDPYLILPMQSNIKKGTLSIGYIYDLQHKELPNLFDKREIDIRNNLFKKILKNNKKIIVNSKYVKNGLIKNYKVKENKIVELPFLPYVFDTIKFSTKKVRKKYGISDTYLLMCNNFWRHKNHDLAFKAFKIFLKKKPNYQLICTGKTYDSRFPNYFKELKKKYNNLIFNNSIKILDLIPRSDQLNLMKSSRAVIQPTLYEGGPGGFAAYEALSIGKKLVLSNIPINKEIKNYNVNFFNPKSPLELSKILLKISNSHENKNFYKKKIKDNKKKFGKFLYKLIDTL